MSDFVIGVDLGTSNCAVAYMEPAQGPDASVLDFPIVQAMRSGDIRPGQLLPSAVYLPHPDELPPASYALPWDSAPSSIVGEFARWQGARVPSRLITSAKSWLDPGDPSLFTFLYFVTPSPSVNAVTLLISRF